MKLFHETIIHLPLKATASLGTSAISPKTPAVSSASSDTPANSTSSVNLKICILSDLHFARWMKPQKLSAIIQKMQKTRPDYIFIPGDLVDNNEEIKALSDEKRLLNFLASLGRIAPAIITPGNHDAYRSPKKHEGIAENPDFLKKVNQLDQVFYLNDTTFEDDRLYVFGYNLKPRYYDSGVKHARFIRPIDESVELLLEDLKKQPLKNLPKNKLKFILIHSPVRLDDPHVRAELAEFDYSVSGHMHFGVIPPLIFEIWRGERGIIAPGKKFFPKNARVSKKTLKNKKIISGAVTNFSKSSTRGLNAFYPIYFTTLIFTDSPKVQIRRKYRR